MIGVDPSYVHKPKRVTPGDAIVSPDLTLKWYDVHPEDAPVPTAIARLARTYLDTTPFEARGRGFVVLHRCGSDFYFLMVCTWLNENELWETVFYKDASMDGFALFPREGEHKPTFCVWELAAVLHERSAWLRFLTSARDDSAAETWLRDVCAGPA